jgi:Predicted metal-binding, possibly nucleic acid-binding protein
VAVNFVERDEAEDGDDGDSEDDSVSFQHGVIDLGLALRDEILLAVPMTPICRPECAGICPSCGRNRNLTPCDCEKQALETSKLGALAKIKLQ